MKQNVGRDYDNNAEYIIVAQSFRSNFFSQNTTAAIRSFFLSFFLPYVFPTISFLFSLNKVNCSFDAPCDDEKYAAGLILAVLFFGKSLGA